MNICDTIHGFTLTERREVPDVSGVAYIYRHTSGLRLMYLEREDENKLFSIAFPTYPTDDTGVFHIIEHSLLCGSDKYPVKEPFAELLKSSLKTLLNAYTYKDKTVYPVGSRNESDFFNLMEVYLDAVFHPRLLSDKNIFLREGHRLEPVDDGYKINGVVYNEMQSGECSATEIAERELSRLLFPDGSYSFNSGGDPSAIPSLTYESLKKTYEKHYNPAAGYVVLDGRIDIERALALIDGAVFGIEPREDIPRINPGKEALTDRRVAYYQVSEGEDIERGARFLSSMRVCPLSDRKRIYALAALCDALAGANGSPLRKKMLKTGLCDAFYMGIDESGIEVTLTAEMRGVKPKDVDRLYREYRRTLASFVNKPLPKEDIEAALSSMEFRTREADAGSTPVGWAYTEAILGGWLYGLDPLLGLCYSEIFDSLRQELSADYFERLLSELVAMPEATLCLLPSVSLEKELAEKRADALKKRISALGEEEKRAIENEHAAFLSWQERADSPEDLARIPSLTLSQLGEMKEEIKKTHKNISESDVLFSEIDTRGIVYTDLYFDISDCDCICELFPLTLLFSEMRTLKGPSEYMRQRIKKSLGSLNLTLCPIKREGETRLYLVVKASALEGQKDRLISLLNEYIYTGRLPSAKRITRKLKQLSHSLFSSISYSPVGAALSRLGAEVDELGVFGEMWYGVSALKRYREMAKEPVKTRRLLKRLLAKFQNEYFVKERLTLGITGRVDVDFATELIASLRNGERRGELCKRELYKKENVGILLPSSVATVIRGGSLPREYKLSEGEEAVFSALLDYEILWNEIRLKGGAYDTGSIFQPKERLLALYSSSEPDPKRVDGVFLNIGEHTEAFIEQLDGGFDKYIIGALGESEPLSSPKHEGSYELIKYLSGKTRLDEQRKRRELLAFDKDSFLRCNQALELALKDSVLVAVGSGEALAELGIEKVIKI